MDPATWGKLLDYGLGALFGGIILYLWVRDMKRADEYRRQNDERLYNVIDANTKAFSANTLALQNFASVAKLEEKLEDWNERLDSASRKKGS